MINKEKYKIIFSNLNIEIDNFDEFVKYVEIFSLKKIIVGYSFPFIDKKTGNFYPSTKSSEIVSFIKFDKEIAMYLLELILFFEIKFKNLIVKMWKKNYKLEDTIIYNFSDELLSSLIPNLANCNDLNFVDFKYSLFEYSTTSESLLEYSTFTKIPIEDLANSWTLATAINFYRVLDEKIKMKILYKLNVDESFFDIFHKMLNLILKVRNMISHNHMIHNLSIKHYRLEFNKVYNSIFKNFHYNENSSISYMQVANIINYLLFVDFKNDSETFLKKLNINPVSKEKLIRLLYGNL
ncbi:MAG: Abi family protein [Malacoplasma sp.]